MPDDTIRFQEAEHDLASLETLTWDLLHRGSQSARDALHSGTLCSLSHANRPASRTMVLRQVDAERRLLAAYTDARSPKVETLNKNPEVSWVFYDARRRLEIRAMGTLRVFTGPGDSLAEAVWAGMTHAAQHGFSSATGVGLRLDNRAPDIVNPTADQVASQSAQNFGNFAVLLTFVERLEFLFLNHAGHHRARFTYEGARLTDAHWVST